MSSFGSCAMKRKVAAGLAFVSVVIPVLPALSIPFGTNTVYKTIENGKTFIYLSATAGSVTDVVFSGVDRTSVRTADACGQIVVPNSTSAPLSGTVTISTQQINYATVPTQLKPNCTGGTLSEPRAASYKTPEGSLVGVGFTANAPQNVTYKVNRTRRVTANACGFARFAGTASIPLIDTTQFRIGTTDYTVSSVPNSTVGPRCANVAGVSRGFKPHGVTGW